jgi:hypothetical protein
MLLDACALVWLTQHQIQSLRTESEGYDIRCGYHQCEVNWVGRHYPHFAPAVLLLTVFKKVVEDIFCAIRWQRYGELLSYPAYWSPSKLKRLSWRWLGNVSTLVTLSTSLGQANPITLRVLMSLTGFIKWMDIMYHFRCERTVGPKILPILQVFTDVGGFGVVMAFFLLAFFHSSYALSNGGMFNILMGTYRLGLLGDFDIAEYVLGVEDPVGDPTGQDVQWWAGWQFASFFVASLGLTVIMTNIFIGVICNSYDKHQTEATTLFVQARASLTLDYVLRPGHRSLISLLCNWRGRMQSLDSDSDEFVWFCHVEEEGGHGTSDEGSVRSAMYGEMRKVKASMGAGLSSLRAEVHELKVSVKELSDTLGTAGRQAGAVTKKLVVDRWRRRRLAPPERPRLAPPETPPRWPEEVRRRRFHRPRGQDGDIELLLAAGRTPGSGQAPSKYLL